jgi:hypothetical protein
MASDSPSPNSVPSEAKSPFEGKRWHEIWNPLNLDVTEEPVPPASLEAMQLFCYLLWNLVSTNVGVFISLLVLLGDPFGEPAKNVVYWGLLCYVSWPYIFLACWDYRQMKNSTGVTFFKVTLQSEYTREHKAGRSITFILSTFLLGVIIVANIDDARSKECIERVTNASIALNISDIDTKDYCFTPVFFLSNEAPKFRSVPFYILVLSYFKAVYDLVFYNEIFHPFMVTSDETVETCKCPSSNFSGFVKNRFPLHFKFAADNFRRDNKGVFSRTRFEPNISIRPDESNWVCGLPKYLPFFWMHWIFTDSNAVLKNILIACSRVSAYVNNNAAGDINYKLTIEQLRNSVQDTSKFASLKDDSVAWG